MMSEASYAVLLFTKNLCLMRSLVVVCMSFASYANLSLVMGFISLSCLIKSMLTLLFWESGPGKKKYFLVISGSVCILILGFVWCTWDCWES